MLANCSYKNVRIVLFERDYDVRQAIKATLAQDTFTQTLATAGLKTAQTAIFNDRADLMVIDIDQNRDEICKMMRKIRHNLAGDNPFPVSIALSSDSDFQNVRQAVNSGFDVMLLKPFSMSTLLDRVHHLMHQRAPFVVTPDYIGPDRRQNQSGGQSRGQSGARHSGDDPLITVPNPLKIMATGVVSLARMRHAIEEGVTKVNERRVVCNSEKISQLVGILASQYMLSDLDHEFIRDLEQLLTICGEMDRRLKRSKFAHAADLCDTMESVVSRILETPLSPNSKDIELLQNLGYAIDRAFHSDESEIKIAHTISDSIRAVA